MTNADLAELFALRAEEVPMPLSKAMKRAGRMAHQWPIEAAQLWSEGQSLQILPAIGPKLAQQIATWFCEPPLPLPEPPPLRRNFLTMAQANRILKGLDESWQVLGDLQMHTEWSDGSHQIQDMADEARRLGYRYIAITDHSKGLKIANGMDEERLDAQGQEIARINERGGPVRVLRSLETNLSPDGSLDMDLETLNDLDVVLGCFHSKLRLLTDQTERYIAALRNPGLQILGHPRGRIYNFRLGLQCDWASVFEVAAELDKAVEIDCFPDRQDLDVATLELARDANVRISLGTDAHAFHQLGFMKLGLAAALKAGISRGRILNLMPLDDLLEWAASLKH